jgi:hypothetical protein
MTRRARRLTGKETRESLRQGDAEAYRRAHGNLLKAIEDVACWFELDAEKSYMLREAVLRAIRRRRNKSSMSEVKILGDAILHFDYALEHWYYATMPTEEALEKTID